MVKDSTPLPTLVRDLMSVGVLTCCPQTALIELTQILLDQELEGVVVLDQIGHASGIVTRKDLVRAYGRGDYQELVAGDVMQDGVPQIPPDIPLRAAAQIMRDLDTRIVYLMHHAGGIEYPAAFLTYNHILRLMAMDDLDDLRDLGIKAERQPPLETFIRKRDKARKNVR
jgi:CBS domain-containing protein